MERLHHHHIRYLPLLAFWALIVLTPGTAHAVCANPAGVEGEQIYNADHNMMQFCNGTAWVAMTGADPSGSGSGSDTLSALSCTADQVAKWDGSAWACAAMTGGSGGGGVSGQWSLVPSTEGKIVASDAAASDEFGYSVSVSSDTAVVGSLFDDDNGSNSGAAYVFVKSGSMWTQQQKLTASDAAADDRFGYVVDLSADTVVVSAYQDDDNGSNSGSAYVFTRSGTTWTQQQKLTASDGAASDEFGQSISIDGDTIVVGARNDDDGGSNSGSAYVFTRSGTTWSQQQKLTASDAAASDQFGYDAALDGDTVVIGAYADDDAGTDSGSAYVFTRSGTTWTQQQKLTASDAAGNDRFGINVGIDGDTAVIGAHYDDDGGSNTGSVYVFTRSGTTWTQQQKLTASDATADDRFGERVDVDGDTVVVGVRLHGASDTGVAYVFTRSGTTWTQQRTLISSDGAAGDYFGRSVAVDGVNLIVGASDDDDAGSRSGSAYIYDLTLGTGGSGGSGGGGGGADNLGDHTATQDLNLDSNKITATIGSVFSGVAGNQPVVPVGAGGMGNIQAGATGLAVEGASCGVVGKLSRSADGKLLVCEGGSTLTDQPCTNFNVGALSFASDGTLVACVGN